MVDEPGDVASDRCIPHPPPVDLKAPDRAALHVAVLPLQALLMRDLLPRIVDDPLVFRNAFGGEHSPTVQLRATTCDHELPFKRLLCQFSASDKRIRNRSGTVWNRRWRCNGGEERNGRHHPGVGQDTGGLSAEPLNRDYA